MNPLAGGAEIATYEIAKRIVKLGNSVHLICSGYPKCRKHEVIDGIEVTRLGNSYSLYILAIFHYLKRLRGKYDVIVDEVNTIPFFTSVYIRNTPKIVYIHQVSAEEVKYCLPQPLSALVCSWQFLMPTMYKDSFFITVSLSTAIDLIKLGVPKQRIRIVWNGVDHKIYRPGSIKSPFPHILYVGRLKAYKRIDDAIKAFNLVLKKVPNAKFSIVGRGDFKVELKRLVKHLNLENHVEFYGYVGEEMKVRLMQKAHVLVYPSIREGFGLSIIEAAACGTPSVAYDVPGLRDSIRHGETGILVRLGDIEALAEALISLLMDDELRKKMSQNALKWSKKFTWDKTAEDFLKVVKSVVDEG
jgi:glycosyltransferase involved in cell wall biosynthesis